MFKHGLQQRPHKQDCYHSDLFTLPSLQRNEKLHGNGDSSGEKHIAQC